MVTPAGRPLPGARVSLWGQRDVMVTSDAHGAFQLPGVCNGTNISAQVDGYSAGTAQARANSSISAVVTIVLQELGRELGEGVPGAMALRGHRG